MSDEIVNTAELETSDEIMVDAVCGSTVDLELARMRGLITEYADREYAFCGVACQDRFVAAPAAYAVSGRDRP